MRWGVVVLAGLILVVGIGMYAYADQQLKDLNSKSSECQQSPPIPSLGACNDYRRSQSNFQNVQQYGLYALFAGVVMIVIGLVLSAPKTEEPPMRPRR